MSLSPRKEPEKNEVLSAESSSSAAPDTVKQPKLVRATVERVVPVVSASAREREVDVAQERMQLVPVRKVQDVVHERLVTRHVKVPVERFVERLVEVPTPLVLEKVVERIVEEPFTTTLEKVVTRVVERVVEVPIPRVVRVTKP
eukprot:RCo009093